MIPKDNLATYRTIGGVPYGLGLEFNKFDQLTDIELSFTRRVMDSPDEAISEKECLGIYIRTADWVMEQYGSFDLAKQKNTELSGNPKTDIGDRYGVYRDPSGAFVANRFKTFRDSRKMHVFGFFMPDTCDITVRWMEAENVERWKPSSEN